MQPTITHNNIVFIDAQAMRLSFLQSFEAPNKEKLDALAVGDFVKICTNNERFWVEVTDINNSIVTGRIDNELLQPGLKINDIITFPTNCIFDIVTP